MTWYKKSLVQLEHSDEGGYEVKYNGYSYEQDEALGYDDDCTRLVFDLGSTVLKVDTEDSMQGRREYLNYKSIPARWREYAAPVYAGGWLTSESLALSSASEKCERYAWVLQKSIPIQRAYEWRHEMEGYIGYKAAQEVVEKWDDFMQDFHWAVAHWEDAGRRQWSIVETNGIARPVLHDLGSYWKDGAADTTKRAAAWKKFTDEWDCATIEFDMNHIYQEA